MRKIVSLFILISLCSISCLAIAANLTVHLNPNPAMQDQTVQLVLETNGSVNLTGTPDLSPLTKDFMILSQAQSNQISIFNGKTQAQTQWVITLMPKHGGKITIPAIHVGKLASKPITLSVKASQSSKQLSNNNINSKNSQGKTSKNIYLDASISSKNPYVQSALLYIVKIYFSVNIADANLTDPQVNNADIKPLNNNQHYQTTIKGKTYHVFTRSYLITPEKSGELIIKSPILTGEAYLKDSTTSMNPFFTVGSQAITKSAPKITINVKPKPANFNGTWWLPAKNISLSQKWSQGNTQLKIGEPITRTITITAIGLTAGQLPELKLDKVNNANVYRDAPQLKTRIQGNQIVGQRIEKFVYIPTKSGRLNFANIQLPWWNINKHAVAYATLSAKTFDILPATSVQPNMQSNSKLNNSSPQKSQANDLNIQAQSNHQSNQVNKTGRLLSLSQSKISAWFWVALILFLLWLATILIWRKPWRRNKNPGQGNNLAADKAGIFYQQQSLRTARDAVIQAAEDNVPNATRDALLIWAQLAFQDKEIKTLNNISRHLSGLVIDDANFEKFRDALADLDSHLYSKQKQSWHGNDFAELFKNFSKTKHNVKKAKHDDSDSLPSLYLSSGSQMIDDG